MAYYLIGYDLTPPGQEYPELIRAIKSYGVWWHHLDSTWLVQTDVSAVGIRNHLRRFLDANDELLVVRVGPEWATHGFSALANQWLTSLK